MATACSDHLARLARRWHCERPLVVRHSEHLWARLGVLSQARRWSRQAPSRRSLPRRRWQRERDAPPCRLDLGLRWPTPLPRMTSTPSWTCCESNRGVRSRPRLHIVEMDPAHPVAGFRWIQSLSHTRCSRVKPP